MFGDIIRKTVSIFGKNQETENISIDIEEIDNQSISKTSKTKMEFNIGVFGTVSAGKSTLINAIFAKNFSQMNIRRTTMVPQRYQLVSISSLNPDTLENIRNSNDQLNKQYQDKIWDAETIIHHNVENPNEFINISDDTDFQYNIYDFPGMNDQTTKDIYTSWTTSNIAMFDVIILVVDIHSGLNTSDEIDVLRVFLSGMLDNPHIKLIILANKCDDMIYDETTDDFNLDDEKQDIYNEQMVPAITKLAEEYQVDISRISIQKFCSRTAFIYRTIHSNNIDVKEHLDQKHLTEMMQYEVGRTRWVRMTDTQREEHINKTISDVINDNEVYKSNMIHSGFEKFASTMRKLTTHSVVLLPVYQANIDSIMYKINKNNTNLDEINILKDTISLISKFNISDDVKEALLQSVIDKFHEIYNNYKNNYSKTLLLYEKLLNVIIDWKDFIIKISFSSSIQHKQLVDTLYDTLKNMITYLKSDKFKNTNCSDLHFNPAKFPILYDNTLSIAASEFSDISTELLSLIPINYRLVWNDKKYITWFGNTIQDDIVRKDKIQKYITFFLNEYLTSITPHTEMFLYYIKYHKEYNKLDFINKICVEQHLQKSISKCIELNNMKRDTLEKIKIEMMIKFGSFFDTIMTLL